MQTGLLIVAILHVVIMVILSTIICIAVGVIVSYLTVNRCVHFKEDNEHEE